MIKFLGTIFNFFFALLGHIFNFFGALLLSIIGAGFFVLLGVVASIVILLILHVFGIDFVTGEPVIFLGGAIMGIVGFVGSFAGCYGKTVLGFSVNPEAVVRMFERGATELAKGIDDVKRQL